MTNEEIKDEIKIVKMELAHLEDVVKIERSSFSDPWTYRMFVSELKSEHAIYFVALSDEKVIGYVGGWIVANEVHITNLAVDERHRGKGIANKLLERLFEVGIDRGCDIAYLEVRASNLPAQKLYNKLGFDVAYTRKGYYTKPTEDALVMVKRLK
ncbi:MAG: ribosomal protein S18-alanine N-acetyltransferase [bacterium]